MVGIPTFSIISDLPLRPTIYIAMCQPLVIPTWYSSFGFTWNSIQGEDRCGMFLRNRVTYRDHLLLDIFGGWHLSISPLVAESLCWRLFRYVGDFLNVLNRSPTHLVSNIRHQHRCNRKLKYLNSWNGKSLTSKSCPAIFDSTSFIKQKFSDLKIHIIIVTKKWPLNLSLEKSPVIDCQPIGNG